MPQSRTRRVVTGFSPETMLRFILVKHVLNKAGQSVSDGTDLDGVIAVQQMDFAIETLLKTVVSVLGPPSSYDGAPSDYNHKKVDLESQRHKPSSTFPRLVDEVLALYRDSSKTIKKMDLPLRHEVMQLHDMRNSAQHNGVAPAQTTVRRELAVTTAFIESMLSEVFGISLDMVVRGSMLKSQKVRDSFVKAENALENGLISDAIIFADEAFQSGKSIVLSNSSNLALRLPDSYDLRSAGVKEGADMVADISDAIKDLMTDLEPLLIGIDYASYRQYKDVVGLARGGRQGDLSEWIVGGGPKSREPSKEEALFVVNLVFDALSHLKL
jgi:hypothetical protein